MKTPLSAALGVIVGLIGCYTATRSEMRKIKEEMEIEITEKVKTATELARIKERLEQLKKELWQHTQSNHQ